MKKRDKNKPIMSMTSGERREMFDDLESPLNESIVNEARDQPVEKCRALTIATGVLVTADGERKICHSEIDYGDGEATKHIFDFIEQSRRFIKPGEKIYSKVVGITLTPEQLQ